MSATNLPAEPILPAIPRFAVSSSWVTCNTIADLRTARPYTVQRSYAHVLGDSSVDDNAGGWFVYNDAATGADDDLTVIKPDHLDASDPGRWIRQSYTGPNTSAARDTETVTTLKAINPRRDGEVVAVSGYSTAGDGGGGLFRFDAASSATANDGTIIEPAVGDGRWFRIYSEAINVKWFGALGDNVTDDLAAIQGAVDAAASEVVIPDGQYYLSGAITVTNSIKITGQSISASKLRSKSTTAGVFVLTADYVEISSLSLIADDSNTGAAILAEYTGTGALARNLRLRDLRIISVGGSTFWGSGIKFATSTGSPGADGNYYSNYNVMSGIVISGVKTIGIDASAADVVLNASSITDCHISGLSDSYATDGSIGLSVDQFQSLDITGCSFQTLGKGIKLVGATATSALGFSIQDCYFEQFVSAGIDIGSASAISIGLVTGCYFNLATLTGGAAGSNAGILINNFAGWIESGGWTGSDSDHKALRATNSPKGTYVCGLINSYASTTWDFGEMTVKVPDQRNVIKTTRLGASNWGDSSSNRSANVNNATTTFFFLVPVNQWDYINKIGMTVYTDGNAPTVTANLYSHNLYDGVSGSAIWTNSAWDVSGRGWSANVEHRVPAQKSFTLAVEVVADSSGTFCYLYAPYLEGNF